MQQLHFYYFGEFKLDSKERRLWCGDELVPLTPKEYDVLNVLIQRAGKVVEKNELLDAVWADTFVEEATLARNVSWLRKKLAKFSEGETFLETVPKLGYRFVAEVVKSDKNESLFIIDEQTTQHLIFEETISEIDENGINNDQQSIALPQAPPKSNYRYLKIAIYALSLIVFLVTGFAIYQNYTKKGDIKAVVIKRVVLLTGETGNEDSPRFSPDGKQITYTWDKNGGTKRDIYVRLVNGGDSLQLTDSEELDDRYPTFSPDGSQIAFIRNRVDFSELVTIPSLGGSERVIRRLFSSDYSMSYSPDGENIAVIDTEDSKVGRQYAVHLVNTQTFERKRLTEPGDFRGESTPRFSPDGQKLAFIRLLDKGMDLFVVPASGGEAKRITFDNSGINSIAWGSKSDFIYFTSYRGGNTARLWRMSVPRGNPELVSTEGEGLVNLAISPDGKTVAYSSSKIIDTIYRVKPDGQPAEKLISTIGINWVESYSPDGSRILFVSNRIQFLDLWTANTEGKDLHRITDSMKNIARASFSADGSKIVFFGTKFDGTGGAFVVSTMGGKVRAVKVDGHRILHFAFGPKGKWEYFTSNFTGENQIWKMKSDDNKKPIQITRNGGILPTITKDGKTIYYLKSYLKGGIWRVPVNGGAEERVSEITNAGFDIKNRRYWVVAETGIYFLVPDSDRSFKIKFYDFSTEKASDAVGDYKIPPNIRPVFATNGEDFLFTTSKQLSNIMLADLSE